MVFMVFWRDGKVEVMEGDTIADAFMRAGYGGGVLKAVDYHAQCELVTWDSLKVGDQFVTNFLGWKIATKTGMGTFKTEKEPILFVNFDENGESKSPVYCEAGRHGEGKDVQRTIVERVNT